ncbi:membrane protein [Lactiplantibacillus plantarum EGD-AQ4]|nr:GlsB/YeaQ/YmgE family stress response membrane protein [Lactiplantibacillus pentosus]EIW13979.1 putative membrane protein [Lactiplantibacillus pentosus KCA1]EQM55582.1 membrane protein [Lactiplantibacillus plantarum EGD-AQ4]
MPWLAAVLMGLTVGVITNAVGTHDRRQARVHLILGVAGAVVGQWLFNSFGPGIAGMRLLPVVGSAVTLIVVGTVLMQLRRFRQS